VRPPLGPQPHHQRLAHVRTLPLLHNNNIVVVVQL
jgi:hypothetical protein